MIKNIGLLGLFLCLMLSLKAQKIEERLAAGICKQLDSVNITTAKTPQQKKTILMVAFTKVVAANSNNLKQVPEFKDAASYEQGKALGKFYSEKLMPILIANCPAYLRLKNN